MISNTLIIIVTSSVVGLLLLAAFITVLVMYVQLLYKDAASSSTPVCSCAEGSACGSGCPPVRLYSIATDVNTNSSGLALAILANGNVSSNVVTQTGCERLCDSIPDCVSWVYDSSAQICYLKDLTTYSAGADTGFNTGIVSSA